MYTSAIDRRQGSNVLSVDSKILKGRRERERPLQSFLRTSKHNEEERWKTFRVNVNAINVTSSEVKLKANIY